MKTGCYSGDFSLNKNASEHINPDVLSKILMRNKYLILLLARQHR